MKELIEMIISKCNSLYYLENIATLVLYILRKAMVNSYLPESAKNL